jgi:hypothetical protein
VRWLACLLLAGCQHTTRIDNPHGIDIPIPVYTALPAELVQDCVPAPLAGTTVGAAVDRLASVEGCLAQLRDQQSRLRALR